MNNDSIASNMKRNNSYFYAIGVTEHVTRQGFIYYEICWEDEENWEKNMVSMDSRELKMIFWA